MRAPRSHQYTLSLFHANDNHMMKNKKHGVNKNNGDEILGNVDEIFGPINGTSFGVKKMIRRIVAASSSYRPCDKFVIDYENLKTLAKFLQQPKSLKAVKGLKHGRKKDGSSKVSKPYKAVPMSLNPEGRKSSKEELQMYYDRQTRRCAEKAMEFYNTQVRGPEEPEYMLVKPLRSTASLTSTGVHIHVNFEAMVVNDPDAPVELFFAELVRGDVEQVNNLGADSKAGRRGCNFCHKSFIHPKDWKVMSVEEALQQISEM